MALLLHNQSIPMIRVKLFYESYARKVMYFMGIERLQKFDVQIELIMYVHKYVH